MKVNFRTITNTALIVAATACTVMTGQKEQERFFEQQQKKTSNIELTQSNTNTKLQEFKKAEANITKSELIENKSQKIKDSIQHSLDNANKSYIKADFLINKGRVKKVLRTTVKY